ncbi:MAG: hypothetical protein ACLQVY_01625 [Limisphaerales bacterium]
MIDIFHLILAHEFFVIFFLAGGFASLLCSPLSVFADVARHGLVQEAKSSPGTSALLENSAQPVVPGK